MQAEAGKALAVGIAADFYQREMQVGQGVQQLVQGVLLVLVQQRHGRVLEAHEGDQPLEAHAVEEPEDVGLAVVLEIVVVDTGALIPVPGVGIGELERGFPVVDILQGMGDARGLHGAADGGNIGPVDAEHVVVRGVGLGPAPRLKYKAAGDIIGDDGRSEEAGLHTIGLPDELLVQDRGFIRLSLGHGEIEQRGAGDSRIEAGLTPHDLEFFGIKGNGHVFTSLVKPPDHF